MFCRVRIAYLSKFLHYTNLPKGTRCVPYMVSYKNMPECIYCRKEIENSSLEHIIPQFLGGNYAPDKFKTREVCQKCNSNFGMFVDGAFARNWVISNQLKVINQSFFDPTNPNHLELMCLGYSDLLPPHIKNNEVCEMWQGRLGEQVYWIRPKLEQSSGCYAYVGGDPQKAKKQESRAYFIFSDLDEKNLLISWKTFENAFKKQKKAVRKILCGEVEGADITNIGFSTPDAIDHERIKYFMDNCFNCEPRQINITAIDIGFEYRFLAKLSIGIAYALFGKKALETTYAEKLYDTLNYKEIDIVPKIHGSSNLYFNNANAIYDEHKYIDKLLEEKYGVMFIITRTENGIVFIMRIGASYQCSIQFASNENLTPEDYEKIGDGIVVILYEPLGKNVQISFTEYLMHKCGVKIHSELADIHSKAKQSENYFKKP